MDLRQHVSHDEITLPCDYTKLSPAKRRAVREEYVKAQEGMCYWCKAPLDEMPSLSERGRTVRVELFPPYFFSHPVHLQHCHDTGMTEGAVHAHCNAVMWQYHGR